MTPTRNYDFSLLGITISFSRPEKAIGMKTPPFCIICHAEVAFEVKTGPSLPKLAGISTCGFINK